MSLMSLVPKYVYSFNFLILVIFTFQTSSAVLLSSYTQQRYDGVVDGAKKKYITLHFLMAVELSKLLVALVWSAADIWLDVQATSMHKPTPRAAVTAVPEAHSLGRCAGRDGSHTVASKDVMLSPLSEGREKRFPLQEEQPSPSGGGGRATDKMDGEVAVPVVLPSRTATTPIANQSSRHRSSNLGDSSRPPSPALHHRQRKLLARFCRRYVSDVAIVYLWPERRRSEDADQQQQHLLDPSGKSGEAEKRKGSIPCCLIARLNHEALYMAVPAIAYAVQNLFMMDALGKLTPLVFQISVQLRILMVAVVMKIVMKTVVTRRKWLALTLLFIGVVFGQLGAAPRPPTKPAAVAGVSVVPASTSQPGLWGTRQASPLSYASISAGTTTMTTLSSPVMNAELVMSGPEQGTKAAAAAAAAAASVRFLSGITSLFIGCCISVLSSVYMEAIFKKRKSNAFLSTRNVHLAFFSILYFGTLSVREYLQQLGRLEQVRERMEEIARGQRELLAGGDVLASMRVGDNCIWYEGKWHYDSVGVYMRNYFANFDALVWTLVSVNVLGGMLIALLLRYSDNIMKTMSTAAAIVVSGIGSCLIFDADLSPLFIVGASLVLTGVLMYNLC